ncbi:MAG: class I SAM-dependent methyltransferase [Lachnospiraceae bacterium]
MEKYFFEAFRNMPRLGPGSEKSTLKALEAVPKDRELRILDVGCGVGTHTFQIAQQLPKAKITAIDIVPDYVDTLNSLAKTLNLTDRVKGICMSMFEMTFESESFDVIWAEGAIYIAGFTEGLSDWKRFLKPNGLLICSEISWLVSNPSQEVRSFWEAGYSEMATLETKLTQAEAFGYKNLSHFISPKEDWTDNYYIPLSENLNQMKKKYCNHDIAKQVIGMLEEEIALYSKYGNEYSYVFYILQK